MVGEPCANIAFGTIVTKRYMPFARVLAQSLREHHPDVPVTVVLVDDFDDTFDRDADRFTILPLNALGIPDLADVRSRYSGFQLTVVAKPYLLRHLLDQGFDAAVFLDADILVVDELTPLLDAIAQHAIVLTPHLLDSLSGPEAVARELNILQSGVCNGGCIAVSQSDSGRRFLSWFADRLRTHCCHDRGQGMHFDQRWLDLVPALFDDVHVLRDPGCNVAYWNLPERSVLIGRSDQPRCRYFHFSGFDPGQPCTVTRYSQRFTMETLGPAASLFTRYVSLLEQNGYQRADVESVRA